MVRVTACCLVDCAEHCFTLEWGLLTSTTMCNLYKLYMVALTNQNTGDNLLKRMNEFFLMLIWTYKIPLSFI